ncbi:hypothetical protein N7466_011203 [Penicillium verhagenii]|uniref:uncharacterized protein n=1 Tax=Penicillium verhagenii TaxID=1562060 RepID=UPI0025452D51|nr:uncharacterized protein N7466_011203 [Penicillium verhagenii]KAJ5917649.1 hypothetical protein N7466_011203 [Penicillium verhagenii]
MSRRASRHQSSPSITSQEAWKVDTPFGPPEVHRSFSNGGIRRLKNTLSRLSPSAMAEKEILRKKNQYKSPLTHRNVDTFVTEQEYNDITRPNQHSPKIQVVEWLERLA